MRKSIFRAVAILILVVLLSVLVVAQDNWVKKADAPVSGGFGEAVVGTSEHVYVLKQLYATRIPEFWRYDCQSDKWQLMSNAGLPTDEDDMPFRTGTALAWDGGNFIYALGGARGKDKNQRLFFRYVISENRWQILESTPHPQGAGDALAWSGFDLKLYAFLGSNERGSHFAVYDPRDNTWDDAPTEKWTITDDGASLTWTGGEYLYALQGEVPETVPNRNFARYHIPTDSWDDLSPIPEPNGVGDGASLLWIGNRLPEKSDYIFALGGGDVDEEPGHQFYRYSISTNKWEQLTDITCPVGHYTGNRLAFCCGHIYYWQGSPTTDEWVCGGVAFYMYEFPDSVGDNGQAHVVISKVYPNPPGRDRPDPEPWQEWIEVCNKGEAAADISEWSLTDNEGVYYFPSETCCTSGTILGSAGTETACLTVTGKEYNSSGNTRELFLSNSGDEVILRDKVGKEVDRCEFGETEQGEIIQCSDP